MGAETQYSGATWEHNQQREQKQLVITSEKVEPSPFGLWDPSQIQVQHLPAFFPRNKLQWERFSREDLPTVLDRISSRLLSASSDNGDDERYIVRASPTDEPLSARSQPCGETSSCTLCSFE